MKLFIQFSLILMLLTVIFGPVTYRMYSLHIGYEVTEQIVSLPNESKCSYIEFKALKDFSIENHQITKGEEYTAKICGTKVILDDEFTITNKNNILTVNMALEFFNTIKSTFRCSKHGK